MYINDKKKQFAILLNPFWILASALLAARCFDCYSLLASFFNSQFLFSGILNEQQPNNSPNLHFNAKHVLFISTQLRRTINFFARAHAVQQNKKRALLTTETQDELTQFECSLIPIMRPPCKYTVGCRHCNVWESQHVSNAN